MKKLTNYAPGPRGIMLTTGDLRWLQPGESHSFEASEIVLPLPDLGTKPVDDGSADEIATLTAENAELRATVEEQGKTIATLTADLEKATKPAK